METEDPELNAVLKAWPGLPAAVRAGILAMVAASAGNGAPNDTREELPE